MIVRHQFRILLRDRRLLPAIGLLAAAILLAATSGIARFRTESHAAAAFDRLARNHILRNQEIARRIERRIAAGEEREIIPPPFGSRAPNYVYTWCHPAAVLPPGPLAWMTIGNSDLHPEAYSGPGMTPAAINTNPLLLWNGYFDLSLVIAQILPIVLILLTYDLVAAERESGVLSLSLAQPVSFQRLLFFKALPGAVLVLGTTVGLIGIAGIAARAPVARIVVWLGATVLYGSFWLALALVVNTTRASASSAAATLIGTWLVLNVLVPTAATSIAAANYPVPPQTQYIAFERTLSERMAQRDTSDLVREYLLRHSDYGDLTHLDEQGRRYLVGHAVGEARERLLEGKEDRFQEQRRKQDRLAAQLSILSPAAFFTRVTVEIAGSSEARREDFLRQKKQHLAEDALFFRPRIYRLPNSVFHAVDYDAIPRFQYREEPFARVWERSALAVAILAMLNLAAWLAIIFRTDISAKAVTASVCRHS
jgi:ABC-2 type transport system permease protein